MFCKTIHILYPCICIASLLFREIRYLYTKYWVENKHIKRLEYIYIFHSMGKQKLFVSVYAWVSNWFVWVPCCWALSQVWNETLNTFCVFLLFHNYNGHFLFCFCCFFFFCVMCMLCTFYFLLRTNREEKNK